MRRGAWIVAVCLLLGALGGGGFVIYRGGFSPPQPSPPSPIPIETPPTELPVPQLAGEPLELPGEALATLTGFRRAVKTKRADDLAWEAAEQQMGLYNNDAVRTFASSSASIAFGPDDIVEVAENMLVVIQPRETAGDANEISLAFLSPEFLKTLSAKPEAERNRAIEAAAATRRVHIRAVPKAEGGSGKTRVTVTSRPDRSTAVTSLSGAVKLVDPNGSEVVLAERMVTKVGPEGQIAKPRLLPQPPRLIFPKDGATYAFRRKAPEVEMTWKPVQGARTYRVLVANDKAFRKIFADEKVRGNSLAIRNLQPGTYYWRVRATDADGFQGKYSAARSVKAVYDEIPPDLAILAPPAMFVAPEAQVELKGKTDPGARVRVNGETVSVGSDGTFSHTLTLKEGVNLFTIEAIDGPGNTQYAKRLITYRGEKRSKTAAVRGE